MASESLTTVTPGRLDAARRTLPWVLLACPILLLAVYSFPQFNGLYGQDPYAYYDYAIEHSLIGDLLSFKRLPPFFWPPGYPLLISLVTLLTGTTPLAGQIISLGMGILTPLATALLAFETWPSPRGRTGWLPLTAGLLAAFTGQLWQSSVVVMSDTTGLACATVGIWSLARFGRILREARAQPAGVKAIRPTGSGWLVLASAAISLAILTRWAYALVAIPAGVYFIYAIRHLPGKTVLGYLLIGGLLGALVLSPVLIPAIQGLTTPGEAASVSFIGDLKVYSWDPANAFRRIFFTTDGWLSYRLPNGLYYGLIPAHVFYFTPLIAVFLLPGLYSVLRSGRAAAIILLAGWAGTVFLFHAGAPWQNFRFGLAYLPPVAIIASVGIGEILSFRNGMFRSAMMGVVLAGILWMGFGGWTLTNRFIDRNKIDLEAAEWVDAQIPPDGVLIAFGLTQTIRHNSQVETEELFFLDPARIETLLSEGRPSFLLVQPEVIENQWRGLAPFLNYHWIEEQHGLRPLGTFGESTLFEVLSGESKASP